MRSAICIRTRLIPMQLYHAHRFHFFAPRFPFMGRQLAVDPQGCMFVEGERASPHTNTIADQYFRRLSLPARSGQRLSETEALARSTSAFCTRGLCLVKNTLLLPGTRVEGERYSPTLVSIKQINIFVVNIRYGFGSGAFRIRGDIRPLGSWAFTSSRTV